MMLRSCRMLLEFRHVHKEFFQNPRQINDVEKLQNVTGISARS